MRVAAQRWVQQDLEVVLNNAGVGPGPCVYPIHVLMICEALTPLREGCRAPRWGARQSRVDTFVFVRPKTSVE